MNKFIKWLEKDFAPKMSKINSNVWIVSVKDSIMQILPFILLSSVFVMLTIPGDFFSIENWPNFWTPFVWTMGMVSLLIAFLIPFNLMEKRRMRKQRIVAGATGLIAFLMIINPTVIHDGVAGLTHTALGAGGMFVAIVSGLFTGFVMGLFAKFSFFKEESVIPEFVRSWFDFMIPIGIVIVSLWVLTDIVGLDLYSRINGIFMPLADVMETPWGFALIMFISVFLYSMGISPWVLTPVTDPIWLMAITANIEQGARNVAVYETIFTGYMWVGGIAATLPLVLMLMFSKSGKLKALGRASLAPGIFNINEPVVFGAIVWNPIMMIPMWLIGITLPLFVWLFTAVIEFAPVPMIVNRMWYMPFPIATWMTFGSVRAIIMLFMCVLLASAIWYPFFKVYEKQEVENEKANVS